MTAVNIFAGTSQTNFTSGGADNYLTISNGGLTLFATEAHAVIPYQVAGTFSKLSINIVNNATTETTTVRLRINGADANQVISVPTLQNGIFQDLVNTDTILAGDTVGLQISNSGGVGTIQLATISILFSATTDTVSKYSYVGGSGTSYSTASTTFFCELGGLHGTTNQGTTEARFQNYSGTAGILSNLYTYIISNARGADTIVRSRKAGADGNMSLTIGAGGTGVFSDNVNTDTIADTNLINYSLTTGAGGGDIIHSQISSELTTTNGKSLICFGVPGTGVTQTSNLTRYLSVGGFCSTSVTESAFYSKVVTSFVASNLSIYLDSNTNNGTSTLTLRVNGISSGVSISIGAGVNGRLSNTSNTVSIVTGDVIDYQLVTGGSAGALDLRTITLTTDFTPSSGTSSFNKALSRIY